MSEYKNTLNLPKTDFPMKANLAQREPLILKKWESLNLYHKIREFCKNKKKFILHDGPPYANGHLHMGHALNKILKDIVVKSKTFCGYDAPFVPGWDCHGLPIELNVEKKIGKAGHKVTATEFRQSCREYAGSQVNIQRKEFKRLGVVGDWENPYLTMDFTFEADTIRSLSKIIQKGHVQQGVKPVYWCLDCSSALAEAEVEYADKTSSAIDVGFTVVDEAAFLSKFKKNPGGQGAISIPIWTTTPWTLPANMAVALSPFIEYGLVQIKRDKEERLLVALPLIEEVMKRYGMIQYQILGQLMGETLEKILLQHPFFSREVPVILGEFVTVESGTGAVHIAGAHGPDDFTLTQKYQIPMINLMDDNGIFAENTPLIGGMHVNKVDETIIDALKTRHHLYHFTRLTHSYPHCWRHKTPVIYRATPQWFIGMDKNKLRKMVLESINEVYWIPDWGKNRIYSMIENRPDWCISRQRTWGIPIALFLHKKTGLLHPDSQVLMEKVAECVESQGIEAWFALDVSAFLGKDAEQYKKCSDVLDVWFDSGVTHECVLRKLPELRFLADLYLEGSDQHRGWFHSALLTSVAMNGEAPYKTVLTHGFVLDIQGRKMSKSLGNVIAPETIIHSLGADILRLWIASVDYRTDILVSDEILNRAADTYRRLRNTARFLLANLSGFDPNKDLIDPDQMLALDLFIVDKARLLQEEIIKAYESYQFHLIYQKIHQFCSVDLGSFYLDIIKDRQYTTKANSLPRRSTQTAMFHMIEALVRWLAPILSFTAEEIWQYIPGLHNESVFLNTWYTKLPELAKEVRMNHAYWEKIRLVRDAVNKEIEKRRNEGKLGSPLEAEVHLYCEPQLKMDLDALENELRFVLITSSTKVYLADKDTDAFVATDVPGLWLQVLPLTVPKCERCWHRRSDVGSDSHYPALCPRCIENVSGTGEVRKYA